MQQTVLVSIVSSHCLSTVFPDAVSKIYSKTGLKQPLKKKTEIDFQDGLLLNAGQKYCRMLQGNILQYFRPSLSYHLSVRSLFCLFLIGHLKQTLL